MQYLLSEEEYAELTAKKAAEKDAPNLADDFAVFLRHATIIAHYDPVYMCEAVRIEIPSTRVPRQLLELIKSSIRS